MLAQIIIFIVFLFVEVFIIFYYCKKIKEVNYRMQYELLNVELSNYFDKNTEDEIIIEETDDIIHEDACYTII